MMSGPATLVVTAADAGMRLDKFLARAGAAGSVAEAKRLLAEGLVRVHGRHAKKGERLVAGAIVTMGPRAAGGAEPAVSLEVLLENEDLVALNKPAGLHAVARRAGDRSLATAIIAGFPGCAGASPDSREGGLVHRLDQGTSGVIVAAKHPSAWRSLRASIADGACRKAYLAEVEGDPGTIVALPEHVMRAGAGGLIVTAPIGRLGRRGDRVQIASGRAPLVARSEIEIVERRGPTTLVRVTLTRGRAHQVRAHLAYLGTPLLGDRIYGGGGLDGELTFRLHAATITFAVPKDGSTITIAAPLPGWAMAGERSPTAMP